MGYPFLLKKLKEQSRFVNKNPAQIYEKQLSQQKIIKEFFESVCGGEKKKEILLFEHAE